MRSIFFVFLILASSQSTLAESTSNTLSPTEEFNECVMNSAVHYALDTCDESLKAANNAIVRCVILASSLSIKMKSYFVFLEEHLVRSGISLGEPIDTVDENKILGRTKRSLGAFIINTRLKANKACHSPDVKAQSGSQE